MSTPNRYGNHIKPLAIDHHARLVRFDQPLSVTDTGFVQFDGWEECQISIFGDVSAQETTSGNGDILYSALTGLNGWRIAEEDVAKLSAHLDRILDLSGRHFDCVVFPPHKSPIFQYLLQKIYDRVTFNFLFMPLPGDFIWNAFFDSIRCTLLSLKTARFSRAPFQDF